MARGSPRHGSIATDDIVEDVCLLLLSLSHFPPPPRVHVAKDESTMEWVEMQWFSGAVAAVNEHWMWLSPCEENARWISCRLAFSFLSPHSFRLCGAINGLRADCWDFKSKLHPGQVWKLNQERFPTWSAPPLLSQSHTHCLLLCASFDSSLAPWSLAVVSSLPFYPLSSPLLHPFILFVSSFLLFVSLTLPFLIDQASQLLHGWRVFVDKDTQGKWNETSAQSYFLTLSLTSSHLSLLNVTSAFFHILWQTKLSRYWVTQVQILLSHSFSRGCIVLVGCVTLYTLHPTLYTEHCTLCTRHSQISQMRKFTLREWTPVPHSPRAAKSKDEHGEGRRKQVPSTKWLTRRKP